MIFWQNLIIVFVSVLVPIIPAYLLYKLLPSTANVGGPFQGLTIKLGGAFAGYFLVLLVVMTFWKLENSNYEVWRISGWTNFEGGGHGLDKSGVFISPIPYVKMQADGSFEIDVLKQANASGKMVFPMLVLDQPAAGYNYEPEIVHIADNTRFPNLYRQTVHSWAREITIDEPVIIKKKPTDVLTGYVSNMPAPTPISLAPTPPAAPNGQ